MVMAASLNLVELHVVPQQGSSGLGDRDWKVHENMDVRL